MARPDGAAVLSLARQVAEKYGLVSGDWNGFNVLHTSAARVGGLDLGFLPQSGGRDTAGIVAGAGAGEIEVVYLLGVDEIDMNALGNAFVIYQGHHGDAGAHRADAILPGAAYTEKDATYVNTEGRAQSTYRAVSPPGEAKPDWAIVRALSESAGKTLPYDSLDDLRRRLAEVHPVFANEDEVTPGEWGAFGAAGQLDPAPFVSPVESYFLTDPISRASETMAECARLAAGGAQRTGTDG